jgi:ferrous iron transport protein B
LQFTAIVITPIQEIISDGAVFFSEKIVNLLHLGNVSIIKSFLIDGLFTGIGVVLSFVPLVAVIFLFVSILEDSGYMSRVAFMIDKLMRFIGLNGSALVPLVIGFGCNLPALSSIKAIPNDKQRRISGVIIPYCCCTARLVIFMFISLIFFPKYAALVVLLMYVISILTILFIGFILKNKLNVRKTAFVIELTPYQLPQVLNVIKSVTNECKMFILKAGKIIIVLSVVVWILMVTKSPFLSSANNSNQSTSKQTVITSNENTSNNDQTENGTQETDDSIIRDDSIFENIAIILQPIFKPTGFGDKHFTSAAMTGFVAKEAVVGTLTTSFETDGSIKELDNNIRTTLSKSSNGHANLAAISFMLFVLIYVPCLATVSEQMQVIGKKRTMYSVSVSILLAWVLSTLLFQIGSRL